MNSAPAFNFTSLTWIVNGSSHSRFLSSSDREYWVLAIHIGSFEYPKSVSFSIWVFASSVNSTPSAPYMLFATLVIFSSILSSISYAYLKEFVLSHKLTTFSARSFEPSEPFE